VLYLTLLLDWLFLWRGLQAVYYNELSFWELMPFLFMMYNASAVGFLVAHELFHKENTLDRVAGNYESNTGTVHQLKNMYIHFTIEHLYGHHKWVSTPHDPATAPKGMTLYQFIPKSIIGSYLSAFKIKPLFVALSTIIEVLFVGAIWKYYDTKTMIFFLSYALGGILILELINYLEHYGLQRKLKEDGTY
jgi:alkane 1-monooxygenase